VFLKIKNTVQHGDLELVADARPAEAPGSKNHAKPEVCLDQHWHRVGAVGLQCNQSAACTPAPAVLRATLARVQVPGQVRLETQVFGICPDLRVPRMQYRITIKSGHDTVADGVTTVNSGVSFTSEQSWNAQARQSGVPNQGNVVPELKTLVQLSPSEAIQSPAVPLEVSVP
jgi:hypothetical protein